MIKVDYLIVGGGIAGTNAAEAIRSKDKEGSITILTEEENRLYSRVLLPHYLRNENSFESLFLRKQSDYTNKNIQLMTATRVTQVDFKNKFVVTADNKKIEFNKLLLASGGKVNRLTTKGADFPEIVYLRTIDDAQKIKKLLAASKEAVVLGGGFIGIEFSQSFVVNKLKTTVVIKEKFFWDAIVGDNSGELLSKILEKYGIKVIPEEEVVEFVGRGSLEKVKLRNGRQLAADIVGVGIGIHLDLSYLQDTELVVKKGVVTNEYLETSVKDVWAAGDLAEFFDPIFGRYHSLGNWANASSQGRVAGANMAGERQAFETTSMYSINIFENNFSFLGDTTVDENTQPIERGTVEDGKLGRLLLRNDRIVGASLINLPLDRAVLNHLIKNRTRISASKDKLSDLSFNLSQLLT